MFNKWSFNCSHDSTGIFALKETLAWSHWWLVVACTIISFTSPLRKNMTLNPDVCVLVGITPTGCRLIKIFTNRTDQLPMVMTSDCTIAWGSTQVLPKIQIRKVKTSGILLWDDGKGFFFGSNLVWVLIYIHCDWTNFNRYHCFCVKGLIVAHQDECCITLTFTQRVDLIKKEHYETKYLFWLC